MDRKGQLRSPAQLVSLRGIAWRQPLTTSQIG